MEGVSVQTCIGWNYLSMHGDSYHSITIPAGNRVLAFNQWNCRGILHEYSADINLTDPFRSVAVINPRIMPNPGCIIVFPSPCFTEKEHSQQFCENVPDLSQIVPDDKYSILGASDIKKITLYYETDYSGENSEVVNSNLIPIALATIKSIKFE
jgi:hypothetical protein